MVQNRTHEYVILPSSLVMLMLWLERRSKFELTRGSCRSFYKRKQWNKVGEQSNWRGCGVKGIIFRILIITASVFECQWEWSRGERKKIKMEARGNNYLDNVLSKWHLVINEREALDGSTDSSPLLSRRNEKLLGVDADESDGWMRRGSPPTVCISQSNKVFSR